MASHIRVHGGMAQGALPRCDEGEWSDWRCSFHRACCECVGINSLRGGDKISYWTLLNDLENNPSEQILVTVVHHQASPCAHNPSTERLRKSFCLYNHVIFNDQFFLFIWYISMDLCLYLMVLIHSSGRFNRISFFCTPGYRTG